MASTTSRASRSRFGAREDWNIVVPPAKPVELELIVRMDRVLRVAKAGGYKSSKVTHDPRFHVGWRHFDVEREHLKRQTPQLTDSARAVVENRLESIKRLRNEVGIHTKMGGRRRNRKNHRRARGEGRSLL
jgi:hypothetical protein